MTHLTIHDVAEVFWGHDDSTSINDALYSLATALAAGSPVDRRLSDMLADTINYCATMTPHTEIDRNLASACVVALSYNDTSELHGLGFGS